MNYRLGRLLSAATAEEKADWEFLHEQSLRKPNAEELEDVRDEFRHYDKVKDRPCFSFRAVVGIACLNRIKKDVKHGDYDWHVSNPVALVEPIPAKGKLMLYRSKIDAATPLDDTKFPTIGDYAKAFGK